MLATDDPIILALTEQLSCYQKLAKLAELQHEYVQQNQTDELLEILTHRQTQMQRLSELEVIIAPAKQDWDGYLATLEEQQKQQTERLIAEARLLLQKITDRDRDDALILQQRKLNVGRQISQARGAVKVNKSYAAAAYGKVQPTFNVRQ